MHESPMLAVSPEGAMIVNVLQGSRHCTGMLLVDGALPGYAAEAEHVCTAKEASAWQTHHLPVESSLMTKLR